MNNQAVAAFSFGKERQARRGKILRIVFNTLGYLFLAFICFLQIFPFWLKVADSLTDLSFIPDYGVIYWLPRMGVHFENYRTAIQTGGLFVGLRNSLIHTISFTLLSLIFSFVLGYVFGKLKFRGRNVLFVALLSTMMVPGEVLMVPNYLLVAKLHLTNNLLGVILPGLVNIFGMFLIKQFMDTIPDSVLEAAELDGANELTKIFRIVMPMSVPILTTYVILTFTSTWNDYLWPMIVLKNPDVQTLQLKMYAFYPKFPNSGDEYVRAAGMILITVPIIVMFCCFQKYFLQSVNTAGLK